MNKEEISLTGKFLYKNPRANLTQTPPIIRNKNDIETIKEYQQINFKLQEENKQLKEQLNKIKEWVLNMDKRDVNATYNYEKLLMLANVCEGDENNE